MADRSWFYASEGQQLGPYPEVQFRELIATGAVRADTLVWTEGMAGWRKATEVPGLTVAGSGAPAVPQPGGPGPPVIPHADTSRLPSTGGLMLRIRRLIIKTAEVLMIVLGPVVI